VKGTAHHPSCLALSDPLPGPLGAAGFGPAAYFTTNASPNRRRLVMGEWLRTRCRSHWEALGRPPPRGGPDPRKRTSESRRSPWGRFATAWPRRVSKGTNPRGPSGTWRHQGRLVPRGRHGPMGTALPVGRPSDARAAGAHGGYCRRAAITGRPRGIAPAEWVSFAHRLLGFPVTAFQNCPLNPQRPSATPFLCDVYHTLRTGVWCILIPKLPKGRAETTAANWQ
jgi:hypothetical protein